MTVIKISKKPDFKEIEQELGIPIECVAHRNNCIYIETKDELTDKQFDDAKEVLRNHFPDKKIAKHGKRVKPRGLGKPNVDKNHLYKNLPLKQKIKERKAALKHYERALSYERERLERKPKDRQKVERSIRRINYLKDKENIELEALVAEKNHSQPSPPKHPTQ